MAIEEIVVRRLLEEAGLHPSNDQVLATTKLHNLLMEQLAKAPADTLKEVEPHYIQPTRPPAKRARQQG